MPFSFFSFCILHCTYLPEIRKGRWGHDGGRIAGRFMRECNQRAAALFLHTHPRSARPIPFASFSRGPSAPHYSAPRQPRGSDIPSSESSDGCCIPQYIQSQAPFLPSSDMLRRAQCPGWQCTVCPPPTVFFLELAASLHRFSCPPALCRPGYRMISREECSPSYGKY